MRFFRFGKKKKGFTLIELLVVVAIIGILAATALPKLFAAICQSKKGNIDGVMGALNGALAMYFADNKGSYPTQATGVSLKSQTYFHSKYIEVPNNVFGSGYPYEYISKDASSGYTICVPLAPTTGCDGLSTGNDEYRYYSSNLGTVDQSGVEPC